MTRLLAALGAGVLFGFGLGLSQMVNPAKVLAFLDVAGDSDPSLALVMAGALIVTLPAFRWVLHREKPLSAPAFALPTRTAIDARLLGGSALFGVGWGLVGFCPGPVVASLAYGMPASLIFLLALIIGALLARLMPGRPSLLRSADSRG